MRYVICAEAAPAVGFIGEIVLRNVTGSVAGARVAGIGAGTLSESAEVRIGRISIANITSPFGVSSDNGAAIGSGEYAYGSFTLPEIVISDAALAISSTSGAGIGIGRFNPPDDPEMAFPLLISIARLDVTGSSRPRSHSRFSTRSTPPPSRFPTSMSAGRRSA
jgi:hypothetical protein